MTRPDLQLTAYRGRAFSANVPLYRGKLKPTVENSSFSCGHRSLPENCPLFSCLILGVHSKAPCKQQEIYTVTRTGFGHHSEGCPFIHESRFTVQKSQVVFVTKLELGLI